MLDGLIVFISVLNLCLSGGLSYLKVLIFRTETVLMVSAVPTEIVLTILIIRTEIALLLFEIALAALLFLY